MWFTYEHLLLLISVLFVVQAQQCPPGREVKLASPRTDCGYIQCYNGRGRWCNCQEDYYFVQEKQCCVPRRSRSSSGGGSNGKRPQNNNDGKSGGSEGGGYGGSSGSGGSSGWDYHWR